MVEEMEQTSPGKPANDAAVLDYARPPTKSIDRRPKNLTPARWAGILALTAMFLQVPWAFFTVWFMIDVDSAGSNPPPTRLGNALAEGFCIFPSFIALAFACYSVTTVGLRKRNLAGIVALGLSLVVIVPTLLGSETVIGYLGYAMALIIQEIGELLG